MKTLPTTVVAAKALRNDDSVVSPASLKTMVSMYCPASASIWKVSVSVTLWGVGGQLALTAQSASKVFGLKSRLLPLTVGAPKSPFRSVTLRKSTVPVGLEKLPYDAALETEAEPARPTESASAPVANICSRCIPFSHWPAGSDYCRRTL